MVEVGGVGWKMLAWTKNIYLGKVRSAKIISIFLQSLCVEGSPILIVEVGGCKIGNSTDRLPDVASQKDRQLELREDPCSRDDE